MKNYSNYALQLLLDQYNEVNKQLVILKQFKKTSEEIKRKEKIRTSLFKGILAIHNWDGEC